MTNGTKRALASGGGDEAHRLPVVYLDCGGVRKLRPRFRYGRRTSDGRVLDSCLGTNDSLVRNQKGKASSNHWLPTLTLIGLPRNSLTSSLRYLCACNRGRQTQASQAYSREMGHATATAHLLSFFLAPESDVPAVVLGELTA